MKRFRRCLIPGGLLATFLGANSIPGADSIVHNRETVELSVPGVQTNYNFGVFTVETGGTVTISGDVRG